MYPVLNILHMLNFLDMFSMGVTKILFGLRNSDNFELQPPPKKNLNCMNRSKFGVFLLKITVFQALSNIKLKVSPKSLCMQVNLADFFSCALKLFGFRFPN